MRERPKKTYKYYLEMAALIFIFIMFLGVITMVSIMNTYCEGSQCPEYVGDMSVQSAKEQ